MRLLFLIFNLSVGFYLMANPLDSLRTEEREDGVFVIHEVDEGETLYSLARRYKASLKDIVTKNDIQQNRIEIGQQLAIPIQIVRTEEKVEKEEKEEATSPPVDSTSAELPGKEVNIHVVERGETLYGIARNYGLTVADLKALNGLGNNDLKPGMTLNIGISTETPVNDVSEVPEPMPTYKWAGFNKYQVQTGETLSTIAQKLMLNTDSLMLWNELKSNRLKIGQKLYYKEVNDTIQSSLVNKVDTRIEVNDDGFERIFEEGIVASIEGMDTQKFLALHRTLSIGTDLKVRNLMNNQVVHVKVVGRLPNTGINHNILLRVSAVAINKLGILDPKSRVEVSYFKQ